MSWSYRSPRAGDLRSAPHYLWWLIASQRWRVALAAMLGTLWMVGLALPPYLLSRAIDDGLRPGHVRSLAGWGAGLLGVGVVHSFVAILRHRTMTKVRMDGAFRTVHAVVEHATKLGDTLGREVSVGEVATVGIGDVSLIGTSLTFVGPGVGAMIAYLVIAVLLLSISPVLAAVVLLGAPIVAVVVGPLLGRARKAGTAYREQQGALTTRMVDIVEGLRVLNGLGGKDLFAERYRRDSRCLQAEGVRVGSVTSWIPATGVGLPLVFLAAVTWLAARMAAAGTISVGELVAVYGYAAVLVVPVSELIENMSDLSQSVVSAGRVVAFLRLRPGSEQSASRARPSSPADLHDPASGVLVAAGRMTALAVDRPAVAETVVDRLGRFVSSEVTWGGVSIGEFAPAEVREAILVADNEADIFAGTLREVVEGGKRRDDDAIAHALHVAVAEDIVEGLPDGLSSTIAAHARNLSGGQRQRIRLVRALLAEPEVLLAVEPTSAVDSHTEATIASRLRAARAGRTTVVTTTSPLVLDQADVVHYLVDGKVVATGTHRELLSQQPGYRYLVSRGLEDETAPASGATR